MATMPTVIKLCWKTEQFMNMFNDTDCLDEDDKLPDEKLELNKDYFDESSESDEEDLEA